MINKNRDGSKRELSFRAEKHYKKEVVAVIVACMFVFLALSFFSYNSSDSTLLHYVSTRSGISNACGVLGANTAALFFYMIGIASYLFLAFFLFFAYVLGIKKVFRAELGRLGTFVSGIALAAALAELHGMHGGFIGAQLLGLTTYLLGLQGRLIVLWGLAWIVVCAIGRIQLIPVVMHGVRVLWQQLVQISKRFVWNKKKSEPTITAGASKIEIFDDFEDLNIFTQNPAMPAVEQPIIRTVSTDLIQTKIEQYKVLTCRRESEFARILKAPYKRLPNSVLSRNLFSESVTDNRSIYEQIFANQKVKQVGVFQLPDASLFKKSAMHDKNLQTTDQMKQQAKKVEEKLQHFGIKGSVVAIKPGPVVTMFEYKPQIDSKISRILALEDDLAMALTAQSMRILAPIPGKNVIGFEIANAQRDDVSYGTMIASDEFTKTTARLPMILGVDISGTPVVVDLATTPHLLVGGATGAGKSVGLNVMLMSLLCKVNPDELKLILIDPKRLEFTPYSGIPHLLFPIVTQPARANAVLTWVVQEMESRYDTMATVGVRGFAEYKKLLKEKKTDAQGDPLRQMPYLVVIIDELADLMMVAGKEVEGHIVRIAQMARAAGIHMIVATQRPSVDVVTGLIKVNFPSRIAFRVSSKIDSRTILDAQGAEKLLGRGDMLFMHASSPELKRVHGAYISDNEVERVADFLREQRQPQYLDINEVLVKNTHGAREDIEDELYVQVRDYVLTLDEISISMLQRQYRIGFNRSARLIEKLEVDGFLAPAQGSKPRKVIR